MEILNVPSPLDVTEAWWAEVAKKSRNSVVFIDDHFCESLQWCGGVARLLNAGYKTIKSFSSFEICESTDARAIFLISSVLNDTPLQILKDIISASNLQHVTIISAANKSVQAFSQYQGKDDDGDLAMEELERKISSWFKTDNNVVEIFSFPLLLLPIAEDIFLMPKFRKLYPILESELSQINLLMTSHTKHTGKKILNLSELEFDHLPFEFRQEIKHLTGVFHNIFQAMDVREEIYSIGHTSSIIASELDGFIPAKLRRRTANGKISLVLVDRTLDLAGPVSKNDSSLYGKVIRVLDNLPNHNIDCAINLAPLSAVHPSCRWTLIPGCFSHPNAECKLFMNKAVIHTSEEAVQYITETIEDHVEEQGQKSSNDLLENVKILFNSKNSLEKYFGIIQQGLGVLESQNAPNEERDVNLNCWRKTITQTIGDITLDPMTELLKLLTERNEMGLSLEDVLSTMLYIVSIGGESVVNNSMQYNFVNAVSLAILDENDKLPPFLLQLMNGEVDDLSALKFANKLWNSFVAVATTRKNLKEYKYISSTVSEAEPISYENFIVRLVKDCISKGQVTDLDYKSSGFKNIIKSGFSLFVNVSRPMPKEASMMIVYIVGGITTDEVKEISELVRKIKPNLRVVIGSSHFTKPQEALVNVIQTNPLLSCD